MDTKKLRLLIFSAFFAAIIFLGTFIIKIPIPNGYMHFGDGFIYIAAILLPLPYAAASAAVGGLLADLIGGFAAYAPFTALIKLAMALCAGLITKNRTSARYTRLALACVAAGVINVAGYFATDWVLYGFGAALSAVLLNLAQSGFAAGVCFVFLPMLARIEKNKV
jgi:uncharacterized membrane protein